MPLTSRSAVLGSVEEHVLVNVQNERWATVNVGNALSASYQTDFPILLAKSSVNT